jgi:hypothetical protein
MHKIIVYIWGLAITQNELFDPFEDIDLDDIHYRRL